MDYSAFIDSLRYMAFGMAGIFAIIGLLALAAAVLRSIFPSK